MKSYLGFLKSSIMTSDRDRLDLAAALVHDVEEQACEEVGREQAGGEADEQRDREALHGAGAEVVEDGRRDHDGQVGVDDRAERAREAGVDGRARRLADPQLL